jgi:hypothetical protein
MTNVPPLTEEWINEFTKVEYSELEQKILDAIPEDGSHINTMELVGKVYNPGEAPRFARQSILHTANSLISKSDDNKEPWEIFKSNTKPSYFWRKPREV